MIAAVGLNELSDLLQSMPEHLKEQTEKELSSSLFTAQENIVSPMKTGAENLQSRTGNLARSIKFRVSGNTLRELKGSLFTDSIYAPIHEHGGTIKGIDKFLGLGRGPLLSIPTNANKTASGVTRMSPGQVFSAGGTIGSAYVFTKNAGMQNRLAIILNNEAMYTFASQVTIRASLKMVQKTVAEVPTLLSNLNKVLLEDL